MATSDSPAVSTGLIPATPDEVTEERSWLPNTFRALRHYNYLLYFVGQLVSLTGSWVQSAALTWLAYELTRESRWPAVVSAAQVMPIVVLGVLGGSLADRWPRRPLIFVAQSGFLLLSLVLAAMVYFEAATPVGLLLVSVLIGVVNAIDNPARLAFVMDMVGRGDLVNAVALNSLGFNVARAIGPAVAGWLLPRVGPGACFLVNGVTFLALLGALLAMRLPQPQEVSGGGTASGSLLDGFRHLGQQPRLILLLVLAGALAFFGWPVLALLPALADRQLGLGEAGYAQMVSAIGGGALVGALVVATFGTQVRRGLFLAGGVGLAALGMAGLACAGTLLMAVVFCALVGGGLILFFATGQASMQLSAGDHNRGRVMGIWLMVLAGAQPVGNLVTGPGADLLGVSTILWMGAGGIAGAAVLVVVAARLQTRRTS